MSNGANNVANQFGDLVVTPRTQPTNQSQPTTPKKERPQSQNTKMRQTNAQRQTNSSQVGSSKASGSGKTKYNQKTINRIRTELSNHHGIEKSNEQIIDALNKTGGITKQLSEALKKAKIHGGQSIIQVFKPQNGEVKKASEYKSLYTGQKVRTIAPAGWATKEKDVLALTLGRYASRIKYFKFKRSALLDINKNNYKKFVTCFDAGASNGSLASTLIKSKVPYLTSVATMYDPGHKFRKEWHLNHYIKGAWYYFKRYRNNSLASDNQCYPEHFVDFSPIYINFLYEGKTIYTKMEFIGGKSDNTGSTNSGNAAGGRKSQKSGSTNSSNAVDMKTNLTVSRGSLNVNNNGSKNSNETLRVYVKFLLGNKFDENFFNFISTKIKVLPYKPVVKTIDLNNEGMLYAIRADISHDYDGFKNNINTFKTKLNNEFSNNKFKSYTYKYNKKTTKTKSIARKLIINNRNIIGNTNVNSAPFFIKLLGDLSQIVYCMERNVFFATNDSSALNMAIRLSRSTGQIKRFKAFYEEESKNKVGMLYINYPVSYQMRPKFLTRIMKCSGKMEPISQPGLEVDKLVKQQRNALVLLKNNKNFIEPTLTFKDDKGNLLKNLRREIKKKLASNLPPSTNALRKFVNAEFNSKMERYGLNPEDKKNIMNRLVYDYASVRRNNLN